MKNLILFNGAENNHTGLDGLKDLGGYNELRIFCNNLDETLSIRALASLLRFRGRCRVVETAGGLVSDLRLRMAMEANYLFTSVAFKEVIIITKDQKLSDHLLKDDGGKGRVIIPVYESIEAYLKGRREKEVNR